MDIITSEELYSFNGHSSMETQFGWNSPDFDSTTNRLSMELDIELDRLQEMMSSLDKLDRELTGEDVVPSPGEESPEGGVVDQFVENKDQSCKSAELPVLLPCSKGEVSMFADTTVDSIHAFDAELRVRDSSNDRRTRKREPTTRDKRTKSRSSMDRTKIPRGSGIPMFVAHGHSSAGSPLPTRIPLSQRTVLGAERSPADGRGSLDHSPRHKLERNTSAVLGPGPSHVPPAGEDIGIKRQDSSCIEATVSQPFRGDGRGRAVDTSSSDRLDKGGYSAEVDYPIRGTISPLTSQGMVKRSVGPVEEVSFVFGRPASPRSERAATRNLTPVCDKRILTGADILPVKDATVRHPSSAVSGNMGGILCENCNSCLIDFKRQALRLVFPDNEAKGDMLKGLSLDKMEDKLQVPESFRSKYVKHMQCDVCETHIRQLKQEAVAMIKSIQHAQLTSGATANIPALVGSCTIVPAHQRSSSGRFIRQGKTIYASCSGPGLPIAAQAQAYLEQNVRAWIQPKKSSQMLMSGRSGAQDKMYSSTDVTDHVGQANGHPQQGHYMLPQPIYHIPSHHWHGPTTQGQITPGQPHPIQRVMSPGPGSPPPNPSAAVSFFARAAQKLSRKKKRHQPPDPEPPPFPTSYCDVIRLSPPPAPPCLLRGISRLTNPGMGKVKVMLKISASQQSDSFLNIDQRHKQVTVHDPSASGYTTAASRRAGVAAPKIFAFDAIYSPDDSLAEVCSGSLAEIVQAVVNGADGCLFTFGHSKLGKTYTMFGSDGSSQTLGIVPCAIAWLFKLINEQKEKTGARFSVRVSAVEVTGRQEVLHDLLADVAQCQEATGVGTAPGVYLREDPICGTQLENQSELRAPTAEKAAYYLDAALAARSPADEEGRSSHVLFTLHVYQYRIEKTNTKAGLPGVAGGRSRLHLIDLGSTSKSKDPNNVALSLSALGNVILALVHGQRHVPHRDSKIAQLLRDSLGNMSCRTCMIAHVSSGMARYNETLQVIQLAARIHRMKRRRTKFSSTSSEDSSTDESLNFRRPYRGFRMGTLREDVLYSSSHSDPDYTSSSEQSCDTVIYIGANGQSLSDRELTDNEGPPRHVPRTNPRLPRRPSGSRSSGDEGSNSDSGRSMTYSDTHSRSPLRSMTPVNGCVQMYGRQIQMHSAPGSPQPGAVSRRANVRTKPVMSKPSLPTEIKEANAHWSEKSRQHSQHPPHSPLHSSSKRSIRSGQETKTLQGEQWVDGPGAAIYPDKKAKEQWVDGPQAFVVPPDTPKSSRFNRKVSSEEQWVDGPSEMIAGSKKSKETAPPSEVKQPMHTSCKFEFRESSVEPKSSPSHQKTCSKVLKQTHSKHSQDAKDRPDSTASLDSNLSTKAEAADSRPVSMLDSGEGQAQKAEAPEVIKVKPFVRDWVQRHGVVNETQGQNDAETGMFIVDSDNRVIGTLESMSGSKKKFHEAVSKKLLATSPRHSPKSSPSLSRKGKYESKSEDKPEGQITIPKSQPQGQPQPRPPNRVAEWIKSVSFEQNVEGGAACEGAGVAMADAETNTEHDSDFERMAASDSSLKVGTDPNGDISFDSSMDTGEYSDNLLHRESIYEIQVEEKLEGLKKRDGVRGVQDVPDDETFSSKSRTDENDKDGETQTLLESSAIEEHVRALTSGSSPIRGIRTMCERNTSPVPSDYDNEMDILPELSRPLLLRKPDGASNPNLLKEVFQEGLADQLKVKDNYIMSGETVSVETMYAMSSHNDSGISSVSELPTSSFSVGPSKPGVSGSEFSAQDVQIGKSGSLKMPVRSKPPLPQKPSPTAKPSSLPKPSSVSSAPSSPCRQISPSKNSHKDISPNQKSKSSSLPGSFHNGRNKDKTMKMSTSKSNSNGGSPPGNGSSKSSSKSPKSAHSKLPIFGSKTSPPKEMKLRKKEKDIKSSKLGNGRVSELVHKNKGTDSDSGNDSGIVTVDKKLLSPYATITKPRTPSHSSSGHGSDNSSTISTDIHSHHCNKSDKLHGGTSSGYESMLRDSEGTASSGQEDSADESSGEKKKGSKRKGTRRSRSAPARSSESPTENGKQSPAVSRKAMSPSPRAWVDTRHAGKVKAEPLDIQNYDANDVERLQRRRTDEKEPKLSDQQRKERVKELLVKQDELAANKDRIMMERSTWSFDCRFLMCFSCKSRPRGTDV